MKQPVTLQLKISEIIYDIQNKTFLTGRSASDGNPTSHIANMQANDDEENISQILRSVTMAVALLRNRLAEYLDKADTTSGNDLISDSDDISFSLFMPSNFNGNVARSIGQAAHQFIVATAIADWFAITARGETTDYQSVAQQSLKALEEILNKRSRPLRDK